jgi:Mg-chelatase subunit ChlD
MNNQMTIGSLSAMAQHQNISLAESFMQADCVLLLDESGSMDSQDTLDNKSRRQVAREEVIKLQKNFPGKIALIIFSDKPIFCPSGFPQTLGGGTNLYDALQYIKCCDNTGMKLIIVSDGIPSRPEDCLKLASAFASKIDVIFIGNENDYEGGRKFLEKLASVTGGQALKSDALGLLSKEVETLLLKG